MEKTEELSLQHEFLPYLNLLAFGAGSHRVSACGCIKWEES